MTWVVRLIVLLPALAGLAGLLARRQRAVAAGVAVGSAALVTALGLAQWLAPLRTADIDSLGGLPLRDLSVPLHLLSDRLSGLVSFVVALVVLAIQVFTVWYLREDRRYGQFSATVSLFAAGMLLVVQSADLALTLVGWEIMGWCSWLLIGHDTDRYAARRAAYKAFIVTRVADIGMVVGLVALAVRAGSTDLLDVLTATEGDGLLTVGLVGVLIGVAGKSGLFPFHDWLPDAMEGPTPASALIHAATMVAAGSYVVTRFFSLYAVDDAARLLLAVLAAVTMVYAAVLAFAQSDVKRLLAYSTLSQIAIMLGALAAAPAESGAAPAISHLIGHAFFKALLFLGVGWLAVLVGGTALVRMRGRLRTRGALRWSMALGFAALAGVPPLIGFFTKETVIDTAFEGVAEGVGLGAWIVLVALLVTVVLTAAYCTRAWLLLDHVDGPLEDTARREASAAPVPVSAGESPPAPTAGHEVAAGQAAGHGHHAPITLSAAVSVVALAVLTVVGTLFLTGLRGAIHVGIATAVLSVLLIAGAALAVWVASRHGRVDAAERLPVSVRAGAERGFGADAAYARFGSGVVGLARVVVMLDRDVVDAYPRATAVTARGLGRFGERAHRAIPSLALVGLVVGAGLVVGLGVVTWL
ncbi:proton-conducting transporter membrane subunit [Intrasporangium sp. DVR]|uniref:NADH-quinone oxidoreductase subunit 5 family protein n=1 Tax=Intrasporangium sp. DVR TaxID=3127867 RepID=UPI00313A5864